MIAPITIVSHHVQNFYRENHSACTHAPDANTSDIHFLRRLYVFIRPRLDYYRFPMLSRKARNETASFPAPLAQSALVEFA